MRDDYKAEIIGLAKELWNSSRLKFNRTARSLGLRESILRNLLALTMTDDERAAMLGLPVGCRVRESAKIISPEFLQCGEYVWVGENSIVDASGGLTIGSHTTIAVGALVWTHESVLANLMMDNSMGNRWVARKPTVIGSGCYIGGPSSIYPGVNIGDKVVVLPMSVITEDIPSNVVVGGSPARVIKSVDDMWIENYRSRNKV